MKRISLHVELEYDDEQMHGDDPETHAWFYRDVLGGPLQLVSEEIGDVVGDIVACKVIVGDGTAQ